MLREKLCLGPFVLDERLARGGMGEVWRAHHSTRHDVVAVKVLDPSKPPTPHTIASLEQEVRAIASLDHEHIVKIYDYGRLPAEFARGEQSQGAPYFVMEYAAGGGLHDITHTLSWPQIRQLLLTVLDALAHAHSRGIIHRDLKPGNILLRQGVSAFDDIILSDFGLAHAQQEELFERATPHASSLVGTPAYMAPEQIQHALRDLGPWTDLYALGCMAWQLIHGEPPFGMHAQQDVLRGHLHDPLPTWRPRQSVPDGLHAWMRSMLARSPHDRFAFASDAARALSLLDHHGDFVRGLSDHERSVPMPERVHFRDAGLELYELRPVPVVGRESVRHMLWRTFERTIATQSPHMVVLRGAAGVGKSCLAQWLVQRAHELGAAIPLSAFHEPNPQAMEVLRRLLNKELRVAGLRRRHVTARIKAYIKRARLVDDTPETVEQDVHVLSVLATTQSQMLSAKVSTSLPELPSWQERQSTWLRFLRRVSQRKAIILWVDDAHWANDMLALSEVTLAQGEALNLPVLIVATLREEALPTSSMQAQQLDRLMNHVGDRVTHVPIEPLPALEHERLIREILPLAPELMDQVARRTHGNPLFTIQLIGDWVQRGALVPHEQGFKLDASQSYALPADIQQLWQSRVYQVMESSGAYQSRQVLRVLQAAATLGRDVNRGELEALCTLAGFAMPPGLDALMSVHRLAITTDSGWSFYHEMLRESLLHMAREDDALQELHRRVVVMLRARYDSRQPRIAERLAYHSIEAGDFEDALPLLLNSINHFRVVGEFFRAHHVAGLWEHAVEKLRMPHGDLRHVEGLLAMVQLGLSQGKLEYAQGRLDRAHDHAQSSHEVEPTVEVGLARARLLRKRGENVSAQETLTRAFAALDEEMQEPALCGDLDTQQGLKVLHARATMALGEVVSSLGQYERARALLLDAITQFRHHTDARHEELGRGLLVLSEVMYYQSDEQALSGELLQEAVSQFSRQGNRVALAYCYNFQGDMARRVHDVKGAKVHYERARALLHALGSHEAIFPSLNLMLLAIHTQDYVRASHAIPQVRQEFVKQGREAYTGLVDLAQACCMLVQQEHAEIDELVARGLCTVVGAGVVEHDVVVLAQELERLLRAGERHTLRKQVTDFLATQS